jgi:hypothetical protein
MKLSWKAFPLSLLILSLLFVIYTRLSGEFFGLGEVIRYGFDYIWGGGMIGKIAEAEPLIYDAQTFSKTAFSMLGLNILLSFCGIAACVVSIVRCNGAKYDPGKALFLRRLDHRPLPPHP